MNFIKASAVLILPVLAVAAQATELTQRVVKKGHIVCYERGDLIAAWAAIQDENYAIPTQLVQAGKCVLLERDRKFQVADFNPGDSVQAVVFPSGQWGRVATVSIKK